MKSVPWGAKIQREISSIVQEQAMAFVIFYESEQDLTDTYHTLYRNYEI